MKGKGREREAPTHLIKNSKRSHAGCVTKKIKTDVVADTWCHGHTIMFAIAELDGVPPIRVKMLVKTKINRQRWKINSWLTIPLHFV